MANKLKHVSRKNEPSRERDLIVVQRKLTETLDAALRVLGQAPLGKNPDFNSLMTGVVNVFTEIQCVSREAENLTEIRDTIDIIQIQNDIYKFLRKFLTSKSLSEITPIVRSLQQQLGLGLRETIQSGSFGRSERSYEISLLHNGTLYPFRVDGLGHDISPLFQYIQGVDQRYCRRMQTTYDIVRRIHSLVRHCVDKGDGEPDNLIPSVGSMEAHMRCYREQLDKVSFYHPEQIKKELKVMLKILFRQFIGEGMTQSIMPAIHHQNHLLYTIGFTGLYMGSGPVRFFVRSSGSAVELCYNGKNFYLRCGYAKERTIDTEEYLYPFLLTAHRLLRQKYFTNQRLFTADDADLNQVLDVITSSETPLTVEASKRPDTQPEIFANLDPESILPQFPNMDDLPTEFEEAMLEEASTSSVVAEGVQQDTIDDVKRVMGTSSERPWPRNLPYRRIQVLLHSVGFQGRSEGRHYQYRHYSGAFFNFSHSLRSNDTVPLGMLRRNAEAFDRRNGTLLVALLDAAITSNARP